MPLSPFRVFHDPDLAALFQAIDLRILRAATLTTMIPPVGSGGPGEAELVADLAADPIFICELPGENDGICGM